MKFRDLINEENSNTQKDKEAYEAITKRLKELKKKDTQELKSMADRVAKVHSAKSKSEFISVILDSQFGKKIWDAHNRYEDSLKNKKSLKEAIEGINDSGIGYLITYSLYMVAQIHVWHLLCPSGQKHMALGELYSELEDEVDELAERFIAQGGVLTDINEPIIAKYDDLTVMQKCQEYRNMVTSCVDYRPEMASIIDGVVDLQELIDNKLYKFKLN